MKTILKKQGAYWLFSLLLILGLMRILTLWTGIPIHEQALSLGLCAWVILLFLCSFGGLAALPLLIISLGAVVYIRVYGILIFPQILEFWLESGEEPWLPVDLLVFMAFALIAFVLPYLLRSFRGRVLVAVLLGILWIGAAVWELIAPRILILMELPLVLYVLVEILHRKSHERSSNTLGMLPVVGLFSLILLFVPVSEDPYAYKWLHKAWDGVETLWEKLETQLYYRSRKGTEFTMEFKGSTASTAQDISTQPSEKDSKRKLKVWLDYGEKCVIYLPGSSMDRFDGQSWSRRIDDRAAGDLLDWQYDTAEHIYALWRLDRDENEDQPSWDVFRQRRSDITYQKMDTKTLFTIPGLLRIQADEERFPYSEAAGRVTFEFAQKKQSDYTLYFLEDNTEQTAELIEKSEGYVYDIDRKQSWGQIAGQYSEQFLLRLPNTVQIENVLAQREALIRDTYLQLPSGFSEEAKSLAGRITKDCTSEYEKILAVETYFRENYKYNRAPELPEGADSFLEYMLEAKEGYCTWFATAACLFLRSEGIPARYVQGYRTLLKGQTRTTLEDEDQHAWCEAYITGYGWIVVEATPGVAKSAAAWEEQRRAAGEDEEDETPAEEELPDMNASDEQESGFPAAVPLGILGGLALLVVGAVLLWKDHKKKAYERLSFTERSREDLKQVIRLLEQKHYTRYPYESVRAFLEKVYWPYLYIDPEIVKEARKTFEQALFSETELNEEQWEKGQKLLEALKAKKKKNTVEKTPAV